MSITIQEIKQDNLHDAGRCDGVFNINSKLLLSIEGGALHYTIVGVEPYSKRYQSDAVDYSAYIDNPDQTVFLAYVGGKIAGEIRIRRNWNHYAFVEEIVVDISMRGRGVGQVLMQKAVEWARAKELPGVVCETQDNNVAACRFYERCGFELGGFDRFLYKGEDVATEEIALYWYRIF